MIQMTAWLFLAPAPSGAVAQPLPSPPVRLAIQGLPVGLAGSVHRGFVCMSCHGPREVEHGVSAASAAAARRSCARCHRVAQRDFRSDAHGQALAARKPNVPSCVSCHGSHAVQRVASPAAITSAGYLAGLCGDCHQKAYRAYRTDVHGTAVLDSANRAGATCVSCHTAHRVGGPQSPASTVAPSALSATCGQCHAVAALRFTRGVHAGTADSIAASCRDCHGAHDILPVASPASPTSRAKVSLVVCARCHESTNATAELHRPGVVADYRTSYHGLAAALGDTGTATCADCHDSHEVRRADDQLSTTHAANRGITCGRCHEGARDRFAQGGVHHPGPGAGHRVVDVVENMYRGMIVVIVGLMFAHNAIDFRRRWRNRRKRLALQPVGAAVTGEAARADFVRFTGTERLQHWLLVASFGTLVVTGFALRYGWTVPFVPGSNAEAARAAIHRGAAVLFIVAGIFHLAWLALTRRGRAQARALLPRFRSVRDLLCCAASCVRLGPPSMADWRDLVQTVRYNLGLTQERPRFGRFSYAEKMEYFALVWGGVVMVGTGLAVWLATPFLNRIPYWGIQLATTIHLYEAILATLAIVVWHFYFVIINPDVFPLARSMVTGRISREEQEREHPLEFDPLAGPTSGSSQDPQRRS